MRMLMILIAVGLISLGAWYVLRDDGLLEEVTEERVESALLAKGLPVPMAECMAPKLTDKLSISQLLKLEKLGPQDGEETVPGSVGEAIDRLRRVDDSEAVQALVTTATGCGVSALKDSILG